MSKKYNEAEYGKKHYNIYTIFGILGDILFYPIIIITLLACLTVYISKNDNKVPTFFGVSIVSISSPSMTAGGFKVKDIVFTTKNQPQDLRAGDIITFYDYSRTAEQYDDLNLQLLQEGTFDKTNKTVTATDYDFETLALYQGQERTTEVGDTSALPKTTKIIFHRIIGVYVDEEGTFYYQTKGDSNNFKDKIVCSDYVIGKYAYTPTFLRSIFQFVSTSTGIIVCIIAPLSLLILFMLFSIIEQISKIFIEKKVLTRKIRYDSEESIEANIGIEMDILDKIVFYVSSEPEERIGVGKFLWGHLLASNNDKDLSEYLSIMSALEVFDKDPDKFWYFWTAKVRSKRRRAKVEKIWQDWYSTIKLDQFEKVKNKKENTNETLKTNSKSKAKKSSPEMEEKKPSPKEDTKELPPKPPKKPLN